MIATRIPELLRGVVRIVRYTHRHPVNRALHLAAILPYAIGVSTLFAGAAQANVWQAASGAALWAAAVAMMMAGHAIEGNMGSITPVLLARLLLRLFCNPARKRVELF